MIACSQCPWSASKQVNSTHAVNIRRRFGFPPSSRGLTSNVIDLLHCSSANCVLRSCPGSGTVLPWSSFWCRAPIAAMAWRTAGSLRAACSTIRCQNGLSKYPASCGAEWWTKNCRACCSCLLVLQGMVIGSFRPPLLDGVRSVASRLHKHG